MKVEEHTHFWLSSAEHDLETAESMFTACKYDWCLFIAHLVLEKTMKTPRRKRRGIFLSCQRTSRFAGFPDSGFSRRDAFGTPE